MTDYNELTMSWVFNALDEAQEMVDAEGFTMALFRLSIAVHQAASAAARTQIAEHRAAALAQAAHYQRLFIAIETLRETGDDQ